MVLTTTDFQVERAAMALYAKVTETSPMGSWPLSAERAMFSSCVVEARIVLAAAEEARAIELWHSWPSHIVGPGRLPAEK